jgi:hypothetical protein
MFIRLNNPGAGLSNRYARSGDRMTCGRAVESTPADLFAVLARLSNLVNEL